MRLPLNAGALGLLAFLMLSVSGCANQAPAYRYTVTMPMMTVAPIYHDCWIRDDATGKKEPTECVTLVRSDYRQIVIDLKAACLASGGTEKDCQTD